MKITHGARAKAILRLHENSRAKVEKELARMPGVLGYEINYVHNSIRVKYDPQKTSIEELQKVLHG